MSILFSKEELLDIFISKKWTEDEIKEFVFSPKFLNDNLSDDAGNKITDINEVIRQLNNLQPELIGCIQKLMSLQRVISVYEEIILDANELSKLNMQKRNEEEKINVLEMDICYLLHQSKNIFNTN